MEKQESTKGTDDIIINVDDDSELKYWSNKFGVNKLEVKNAVNKVGRSFKKVAIYLKYNGL